MAVSYTLTLRIAGGRILVYTSCPQTAELLVRMFRHHRSEVPGRVEFEHHVHIRHTPVAPETAELLAAESRVWNSRLGDDVQVTVVRDSAGVIALKIGEEAYSSTDVGKDETVVHIVQRLTSGQGVNPLPWVYMLPIIQVLLSCYDIHVIHSAAVAHKRKALLLLGESGAGKTTLCLALAREGMAYMGDDLVAVQRCDGAIRARALLLEPKLVVAPNGGKSTVDVVSKEGLACLDSAPVSALAHLRRHAPELREASQAPRTQVLSWLLSLGASPAITGDMACWFSTVFEMSERVTGWQWSPAYPGPDTVGCIVRCAQRMIDHA